MTLQYAVTMLCKLGVVRYKHYARIHILPSYSKVKELKNFARHGESRDKI